MVDWFYVCACSCTYVLDFIVNSDWHFNVHPHIFSMPLHIFKISTSLIFNRYRNCAITKWVNGTSTQQLERQFNAISLMWNDKKSGTSWSRLNDASVNASIRLCLRVMIIRRQERRNKKGKKKERKRDDKVHGEMKLFEWNLHFLKNEQQRQEGPVSKPRFLILIKFSEFLEELLQVT